MTYEKHIPCVECLVFQQSKKYPNGALICETARAISDCLMMKRLAKAQALVEKWRTQIYLDSSIYSGQLEEALGGEVKCNNIHSQEYGKWCVKRKCAYYPCSQFKATPKNRVKDVVKIRGTQEKLLKPVENPWYGE